MGFFSKIFATKEENTVVKRQGGDFKTALSLHLNGDVEAALTAYLELVQQRGDDSLAHFFSAAIEAGKGGTAEAAETVRSLSRGAALAGETVTRTIALELSAQISDDPLINIPAVAAIVTAFGDTLKKEGLLRECAVCFELAASLVPDHADVLYKFGDTLHDLRMYDYAESILQEALRNAPNHWGALYTYAVLLQDLGRNEDALSYYEKATRLNPDHATCQNNYGAALLRTNRLQEALVHGTLAAELDPSSPFVKNNLGSIHLALGEYEKARASFSEAIALNGSLGIAYFGLASAERSLQGDPEKIKELYRKTIELNPSLAQGYHALGNLLAEEGDAEALAHFSSATLLNDGLQNLHKDFANACLRLGRRKEALKHFKVALQQDPDDMALQNAVANFAELPG